MSCLRLIVDRLWDGAPALPTERVELELRADADALVLCVDAPFHGDPPPPGPPGPTDRLWEYEVVELFITHYVANDGSHGSMHEGAPGEPPLYSEIELGPHGHHLVLLLDGVRHPVAKGLSLPYSASIDMDPSDGRPRWRGEARLARSLLPPAPHRGNAYAIHGMGAARRHLAWTPVPGVAPDFHRLELFRELILPSASLGTGAPSAS